MENEPLAPKETPDQEAERVRQGIRRAEFERRNKKEQELGLQEGGAYEISGPTEEELDRIEQVAREAREKRERRGES